MPNRPAQYRPSGTATKRVESRPSARERGYTTAWDRRRARWLREQWEACDLTTKAHLPNMLPPCAECTTQGRITEAKVIDHRIPHRGDQRLFWLEANWQPLCEPCHNAKTARGE